MSEHNSKPRQAVSPNYRNPPPKPPKESKGGEGAEGEDELPPDEPLEKPEALAEEKLAPKDSLTLFASDLLDQVLKHKNVVLAGAGALALFGVGFAIYSNHRIGQNADAAEATARALRKLPEFSGEPEAPVLESVEAAKGEADKAGKSGRYKETATELSSVAQEYQGLSSAELASLYAGYSYLKAGEASEALKVFQSQAASRDPAMRYFALSGMVSAQALAGNEEGAIQTLRTMTTELGGVWRETALLDLGRSLEGAGKKDEAATAYAQLLKDNATSQFATSARERLSALKPDAPELKPKAPAAEAPSASE